MRMQPLIIHAFDGTEIFVSKALDRDGDLMMVFRNSEYTSTVFFEGRDVQALRDHLDSLLNSPKEPNL